MRTSRRTARFTSSDSVLHLECPVSWDQLSGEQLRYVLDLLGSGLYSDAEVRTYMLFRFCGIEALRKRRRAVSCRVRLEDGRWKYFDLQDWQVQDMIGQLRFVGSCEGFGRGLDTAGDFRAADRLLSDYCFGWFLMCEKNYQSYLNTRDPRFLDTLARWLFIDPATGEPVASGDREMEVDTALAMSVFLWFSWIKERFARDFPHFLKPAARAGAGYTFLESYNAQLRALTDGDVTKEEAVRRIGCRRALTELDAKAREADEFNRKYGNK